MAPRFEYLSELQPVYEGDEQIADYDVTRIEAGLDFGIQLRHYAELRVGPAWGMGRAEVAVGASGLPESDEDYAGFRASLIVDRQDRTLFAREGYFVEIRGVFARKNLGCDGDFDKLTADLRKQYSFGDHTLVLGLQAGTGFDSELPAYAQLTLGGPFGFAGLAEGQFRGSHLGVGSLAYRYRLLELPSQVGRGVFALVRFDAGNVWTDEVDTGDLRYGGAIGVGADTAIGPLYLAYGRTDDGYDAIYLSLGSAF